ncbi:restriction endonuclease-like protein [Ruthenibacterium lactatiformans]|uniref:restriction endonuclease-like protein n=1 Tax=Ruthenibacterium lactatiformans TaxID=1550024 RepID=UPI00242EE69E|nr:restriction endonuclease-like protein [Ruthenibacterium lactatiformans]
MASLHTGSDELVYIQTDKVSVTIKGQASHPNTQGSERTEKESFLKVFCDENYEINLKGDAEPVSEQVIGNACLGEYRTVPIFYEQQRYEIVIESFGDKSVEFWHDNYNIRNKVTAVGRSSRILSGVINFGNEIGMSDLVIRVGGVDYLRIVVEVFPSKISYKDDYKAIVADVTAEVYNVIFDLLKKTYLGYRQNDKVGSSLVEFFAVISKIYEDFVKAADMILAQPHHELEAIREILPSHKIRSTDNRSIRWIEKHPDHAVRTGNQFAVDRALAVRKQVTYDTRENRLTKHILQSTAKKLLSFKQNYIRLQRETDAAIVEKIDGMIQGINRRCNTGFLANVGAHEASSGMSLVFSMAPGYRDLYKYYLMLLHGLSVTGDVFNISVKDMALLYEYWCFIKLNSLMRNSDKYILVSQDIVKVQGNGLYVSLVKGKASRVKYRNQATQELITLSYNPKEIDAPTITQKPDNVLTLEKKGADVQYEYVFDAKYRINPALPGTDYYNSVGHTPGPEIGDINTMHRYRDAIVYRSGASPFERTMFGAYVLFPYNNEKEYRNHRFFESIDKVNIGGLPFLPSATSMVTDMLDQLISDSPTSAFERTTLPRGIEAKLAKVDWSVRDVLIGTLSSRQQLNVCLNHRFYHIPAARLKDSEFPVRYVAIYQSKTLFGAEAGVQYYGEVTKCVPVRRGEITEIQARPGTENELYYRFEIKEWKHLSKPIAAKEMGFVKSFTNLFLLEHSAEMPELWIHSEEEYRLYSELKRAVNDTTINDEDNNLGFNFGNFTLTFDDGQILVAKGTRVFAQYAISDFSRSPNAVFRQMQKEFSRIEAEEQES